MIFHWTEFFVNIIKLPVVLFSPYLPGLWHIMVVLGLFTDRRQFLKLQQVAGRVPPWQTVTTSVPQAPSRWWRVTGDGSGEWWQWGVRWSDKVRCIACWGEVRWGGMRWDVSVAANRLRWEVLSCALLGGWAQRLRLYTSLHLTVARALPSHDHVYNRHAPRLYGGLRRFDLPSGTFLRPGTPVVNLDIITFLRRRKGEGRLCVERTVTRESECDTLHLTYPARCTRILDLQLHSVSQLSPREWRGLGAYGQRHSSSVLDSRFDLYVIWVVI